MKLITALVGAVFMWGAILLCFLVFSLLNIEPGGTTSGVALLFLCAFLGFLGAQYAVPKVVDTI